MAAEFELASPNIGVGRNPAKHSGQPGHILRLKRFDTDKDCSHTIGDITPNRDIL